MATYKPDFITHYYRKGTPPFRSLSSLSDNEAVEIMKSLYEETMFGVRFKDPLQYLQNRRRSEEWVRKEFKIKGGAPLLDYPISFVLGESKWLTENSPDKSLHSGIKVLLSDLGEGDVSFTYPDSMISYRFGNEKPVNYYLSDFIRKGIHKEGNSFHSKKEGGSRKRLVNQPSSFTGTLY
jgi:hypothetical protein